MDISIIRLSYLLKNYTIYGYHVSVFISISNINIEWMYFSLVFISIFHYLILDPYPTKLRNVEHFHICKEQCIMNLFIKFYLHEY